MIYTSYFSNYRNFPAGVPVIAISRTVPNGFNGYVYKKLAPTYDILNRYKYDSDWEKYRRSYISQVLNKLDVFDIFDELYDLIPFDCEDIILVCYEKPDKHCHRHIVREWLTKAEYECQELAF